MHHWKENKKNCISVDNDVYKNIIMTYYIVNGSYTGTATTHEREFTSKINNKGDVIRFAGDITNMNATFIDENIEIIGLYIYYDNLLETFKNLKIDVTGFINFYDTLYKKGEVLVSSNDISYKKVAHEILSFIDEDNHFMIKVKSLELFYNTISQYEEDNYKYNKEYLRKVEEVKKNIDSAPENHYSLEEMAKICGISQTYFKQIFTYCFNQSPYRYIIIKRLEKAKDLIVNTDISILEISSILSFASSSKFSCAFKKHYGCTPRQLRKVQIV